MGSMRTCRSLFVAVAVCACAGRVSPPGAVSPDRPGYTDTPPVLPSGALQLEVGYTDDRMGTLEYSTIGETLLRVGVGGRSEVRLFGNSFATRSITGLPSVSGMEDPKFGMKTTLHTKPDSIHSAMPNVAALAALTLPMGATPFRALHAQPEAKLAANWTTPTPFSVYSNFGVGAAYDGVAWGKRGWVSTAVWYAVNPKVSVFGEGITVRQLSGSTLPSNDVDAGITYLVNDRFQLDLRAGHGFGSASSGERFVGVGLARRW
jgi:hypothetical protein